MIEPFLVSVVKRRVDYVDSFGRTRRCLRKDLPAFQRQDEELRDGPPTSSESVRTVYNNFVKPTDAGPSGTDHIGPNDDNEEARKVRRQQWEQEAEENARKSKLHYQDVLFQGRTLNRSLRIYFHRCLKLNK